MEEKRAVKMTDMEQMILPGDKDTGGCVRVSQSDLEWPVENVGVGTWVEL